MPLSKSKGNMYPWVTHTHTHIGGECAHKCSYCYVQAIEKRFGTGKYSGQLRLLEDELSVNYGKVRTIFIEHCNDMWAEDVPDSWIDKILNHCNQYPDNTYVFQTKNPERYIEWLGRMPPKRIVGCTIETSSTLIAKKTSEAMPPGIRFGAMRYLSRRGENVFITIEPILKGNMRLLADLINEISPDFVNIGADSKGTGLEEPTAAEVLYLIEAIKKNGIEIKQKRNLDRLLNTNSL
jgi:DNA repair photolyase